MIVRGRRRRRPRSGAAKTSDVLGPLPRAQRPDVAADPRGRRAATPGRGLESSTISGPTRRATAASGGGGAWRTPSAGAAGPRRSRCRARGPASPARRPPRASSTNGWASMPAVMRVWTKPGRTTMTRAAGADQGVGQALGERIEAGLGRSVHEVGLAGPLGRPPTRARRACRGPAGGSGRPR